MMNTTMELYHNGTSMQNHSTSFFNDYQIEVFTTVEDTKEEPAIASYWQYKLQSILFIYVSPFLIICGTMGNLLSLLIVQSTAYKSSPSSLVLGALAVADTGMLNTGLLRHWIIMLTAEEVDVRAFTDPGCKIHFYFTYLFGQLSSWYLVLLTIERAICIFIPLKCKRLCSKRRMVIAIGVITVTLMLINCHAFFTLKLYREDYELSVNMTITYFYCYSIEEAIQFHQGAWYWMDSTLVSFLPFLIIFAGNILIISKLFLYDRKASSDLGVAGNEVKKTKAITVMLLTISTTFLLLTLPSCIYFLGIGNNTWANQSNLDVAKVILAYAFVNLLAYTNHAINFILYCLSGSKFRKAFVNVVCFCKKPSGPVSSTAETSNTKLSTDIAETSHM